jgi:hypothetical protein
MEALARCVESEWLDHLPAQDPRARRSRRDLVRVNALMGNVGIVAAELAGTLASGPLALAEIGAGSGEFAAALCAARALRGAQAQVTLVDRQRAMDTAPLQALAARGWGAQAVQADVFDWLQQAATPSYDAIVANLFLHHFESGALARMLGLVARRTALFIACEPRRSRAALAGARLLGAVGCNDVTRHDAVASVRAGFRGREISALWPRSGAWHLAENARGPFSHLFVARGET